jgi:LysM repeat protein
LLRRTIVLLLALSLALPANAASYVVRPGDTLSAIAGRYHVSVGALARVNGIANVNLVQAGRVLLIPVRPRTFYYRVRWGDTLIGIGSRYHLSLAAIRALNPRLGAYLLAGQWLKLCGPCSWDNPPPPQPATDYAAGTVSSYGTLYIVRPGDTLTGIAARFGVSAGALLAANRIPNPDRIVIGWRLRIPAGGVGAYDPWQARSLIANYAQSYGVEPALALAIGWQESGFNQSLVSRTGAVGVMQVEPYTAERITALTGRRFNLYAVDDNVHAGIFWLAHLLAHYGGNERLATAAYYEGTKAVARYGFFQDTIQYVNNVMALKSSFGG